MDLNSNPLFAGLARRLDWLGQRTNLLAQNVANANTPGYRAKDLVQPSFRELLRGTSSGLAMARTNEGHIGSGGSRGMTARLVTPKEPYATTPTGNSVVLEEQMVKLAETQIDHRLTLNLYRKNLALLKMALGRGG